MPPRISALLGVIMYAPIVAIAVSVGATGYHLLTAERSSTPSCGNWAPSNTVSGFSYMSKCLDELH